MRVGGKLKPPLHRSHEQLVAEIALFKSQFGDTLTEEVAGHIATFLHDWFINALKPVSHRQPASRSSLTPHCPLAGAGSLPVSAS